MLHRVGHRLLCAHCLTAVRQRADGSLPPLRLTEDPDLKALYRLDRHLAGAGIIAKALFFLFFFWWASRSPTGSAALRGALAADMLTFFVFSLTDWNFRGFQIRSGAAFEFLLVMLYLNREPLFRISADPVDNALVMLFFLLFAVLKTGVWGAQHAMEVTGVKERV